MVDKFDFYDFNQQRDKVHKLKSLELEYKLNIDTISEEGKKQIKLGDDLTLNQRQMIDLRKNSIWTIRTKF